MMSSDATLLAKYIRDAAQQRRYIQPWLDDRAFERTGGKLFYAVDADVISFYIQPEERSIQKGYREGYAQIFHDDSDEMSISLGRTLAEHIFHTLEKAPYTLMVIPPIEEEIRNMYKSVANQAEQEQHRVFKDFDSIRNEINSLKSKSHEELLEILEEKAPHIRQFLAGGSEHSAKLLRFGKLLKHSRIATPVKARENKWITDKTMLQAIAPIEYVGDMLRIRERREEWVGMLREQKKGRSHHILSDAQALAHLEWINKHLDDSHRLVYITGARTIHQAASQLNEDEPGFDGLYLRHPRAYLGECLSLPASNEELRFDQWLDTFLDEMNTGGRQLEDASGDLLDKTDAELEKMAKLMLGTHPDTVSKFRQEWTSYTSDLGLYKILSASSGETEYESINALVQDIQVLFDKVEQELNEKVENTWNACFDIAMESGYVLSVYKEDADNPSRNPPPLSFDTFSNTRDFVQSMLTARTGPLNPQDYKHTIDALMGEDKSGYAYNLAYAQLFAAKGNWHVSGILAKRALHIAITRKPENISGREAAYLRAVALRHQVRGINDLNRVGVLLEEANKYLNMEVDPRPQLKPIGIRFEAERIALDVTLHLFQIFRRGAPEKAVPSLANIQESIRNLLTKLGKLRDELDPESSFYKKSPQIYKERLWILRNVDRNLLTNLFMVTFLRLRKEEKSIEPKSFLQVFESFKQNIDSEEKPDIICTYYVKAIYIMAEWWTTDDSRKKHALRRELEGHLSDPKIKNNAVFPYDKDRYEFIREIVTGVKG